MNIFEISEQYFCCPMYKGGLKTERIGRTADGVSCSQFGTFQEMENEGDLAQG